MRKVESDFVTTTGGKNVLLKEAQAVPEGATRAVGRLTDPTIARRNRMQRTAGTVEAHLIEGGGSARVSQLAREIAANRALPAVKTALRNARMTLSGLFRLFPSMFRVRAGTVTLVNAPPPAPAPAPAPAEVRPETREECNARLDTLLAESRAREDAAREARQARERERLAGLRGAFGSRPR